MCYLVENSGVFVTALQLSLKKFVHLYEFIINFTKNKNAVSKLQISHGKIQQKNSFFKL